MTGQPPPPARPVRSWVLAGAALCATVPPAGWLVGQAVQPPGYSPLRQTISVLAGHAGAHRWVVTGALLLVGVCYVVTGAGLRALPPPARIGMAVAGVCAIGAGLCPEPVVGTRPAHMAFTTVGAATIAVWPALTAGRHGGCAIVRVPVAAVATAIFLALLGWLLVEAQTDRLVGLAERVDTSIEAAWPLVVTLGLRRAAQAPACAPGVTRARDARPDGGTLGRTNAPSDPGGTVAA